MNFALLLTAIGPVAGLIALGAVFRRWRRLDAAFWRSAEALVYFVLFPALWVDSLSGAPDVSLRDAHAAGAAAATVFAGAVALWLTRPLFPGGHAAYSSVFQGALRFNTYIGLSLAAALLDADGFKTAVIIAATMSVTLNVVCVITLTAGRSLTRLVGAVAGNPLVIACLIGVVFNIADAAPPAPFAQIIAALADASAPMGLLVVGAAIGLAGLAERWRLAAVTAVLKLLAAPLAAAGVARLLGVAAPDAAILVLFFALPTAPAAYALARELGGDAPFMAQLISLQTLASGATLTAAIVLLGLAP